MILLVLLTFGCAGPSLLGRLSSGCRERGHSLVEVHRLLAAGASLIVGRRPWGTRAAAVAACGLHSCSSGLESTGSVVAVHRLICSEARGIFLDQGSDLCLLLWQSDSLSPSHQGSPISAVSKRLVCGAVTAAPGYLHTHCLLTSVSQ